MHIVIIQPGVCFLWCLLLLDTAMRIRIMDQHGHE